MSITKKFIYLVSFGIVFLAIGAFFNNSLTIFIIYNLCLIALLTADYLLSDEEGNILIERFGDENLSVYEKEKIAFRIRSRSDRNLYLELKDEIPEFHFKAEEKIMKGTVLPHEKKEFDYYLTPTKRGAFIFGNLHVKYEGKLRLCFRMYKVNLSKEYKVYPNLKNLRQYRLSITNNRMVKQGQKNLKMLGKGTAFESLREYIPGDEYRKINWKATARSSKPILNQYEPEKNQHVYFFIDIGRPMSYTVRGNCKLDLAVNTALVLSDVVNQNGDQSGLLIFNTEVTNMIMPGKGAAHRNKILEALYHVDHNNQTSNYEEAFYHFKKKERHRSIIFLFTDFETAEEAENMLKVLPPISKNNILVILLIKNEPLEQTAGKKINSNLDLFNKGVAVELLEERHKIISLLNRKGILCLECPAEKLEYSAVNKYIQLKNKTYL